MVYMQCFFRIPHLFSYPKSLIYGKNNKKKTREGKLVEGLKIAAYVAEVVMASTVIIELVGSKCGGKSKVKAASVETGAGEAPETE